MTKYALESRCVGASNKWSVIFLWLLVLEILHVKVETQLTGIIAIQANNRLGSTDVKWLTSKKAYFSE